MAHSSQKSSWGPPSRGHATRLSFLLFTLLITVSPVFAQPATGFRVVPVVRQDKVYVTFDLADGFTEDVRAAIQSGLKTTFTYDVELRLDVPGWVDRTIGTSTVTATVEYNNLLRRYTLTRVVDGRQDEQEQVDSEGKVRQWMTSLKALPLFDTQHPRSQSRVLRPRPRHRPPEQRVAAVAVRQRHVGDGQVHLH